MTETEKKPDAIEVTRMRKEAEEKQLIYLRRKIPSVNDLLNSVSFLKSFTDKMNSQVLKSDTLHIMHTRVMMEILEQLKLMNENLENLLDAKEAQEEQEMQEDQTRVSKKLSRGK